MYKYIQKTYAVYTQLTFTNACQVNKLNDFLYKEIIRYKYTFWRRQVDIDLFLYKMFPNEATPTCFNQLKITLQSLFLCLSIKT